MNLLDQLIFDEKKTNILYRAGPYWSYKNKKAISELKKKGLNDFRGMSSGIGNSFSDNLVTDIENELNLKGTLVRKIFSLPILNIFFKLQLEKTSYYLNQFLKNQSVVYKNNQNVIDLLNKYKFENTVNFGCIQKFKYNNSEYSTTYIDMADRINILSELFNFKNIRSFFEIGGGFGANTHFLITNFPNIKKIIYLDIVPNIYVGTEYLRYHFKDKVKDYLEIKNLNEIKFSNTNDLEILCIPPWLIEKLNIEIDHFHNAASFVEMPKKVIQNYVNFIKKFNTKEISLISYDGYDDNTTFNPKELNSFFNNKLNLSWKNFLIQDYNRKLIFLTSK